MPSETLRRSNCCPLVVSGARAATERDKPIDRVARAEMDLGKSFARLLAAKDFEALERILHPDITFRALTPGRSRYLWESHEPHSVVDDILRQWFEETDVVEGLVRSDVDRVSGANRVSYRIHVRNSDGKLVVEQQAYYSVKDGKIHSMSLVCSGFQPRTT